MGKTATMVCFITLLGFVHQTNANHPESGVKEVDVGVILDRATWEAKILESFISMAISNFYTLHAHYETRLLPHIIDSRGDPLLALSAAMDLLNNSKVKVIMGAQTSMEAKFLAELGDKARVPVISFTAFSPSSSAKYPYLVHVSEDDIIQVQGIAAIVELFSWRDVIIVYEDTENGKDIIPYSFDSFHKKGIQIAHKCAVGTLSDDGHITEELQKLVAMETTIFVVHASHFLVARICLIAKRLGMMNEGYAWILTAKSMNFVHLMDSSMVESMQGVIGFRSFIPSSKQLENFTKKMEKKFQVKEYLSAYGLWVYDVCWSLAEAAEMVNKEIASIDQKPEIKLEMAGLYNLTTCRHGSVFLREILQNRFRGLSGDFQFKDGKLVSNGFEVVNVIGRGERRVGYWTNTGKLTGKLCSSENLSSNCTTDLESIIWPGGFATPPKGYRMQKVNEKLRIGVPIKRGFKQLINVDHDHQTNKTAVTGFCVDVFRAAVESLPYEVNYEFVPFVNATGQPGSYPDLIYQVYSEKFDAAVGDITITSNRTSYVDFTIPFTDMGIAMVAKKQNEKSMWIFLKPLTAELWLSTAAFLLFIGFVVWLIEHRVNHEFQGSPSQQIGTMFWFSFSTLVFAHRERLLSNLSRFVVIVWTFVVLILTSSYTATLTSMMTVEQFHLSSKGNNILALNQEIIIGLNFENPQIRQRLRSSEEYVQALSRGSKKGGVSAIIDEVPYIKLFLASHSEDYAMIEPIMYRTNGFAFAFRKGSPLVHDMSKAIAGLREEGQITMIQNAWFKTQSALESKDPTARENDVKPLTFKRFSGLFLITGISSTTAIFMFSMFLFVEKWQAVRRSMYLIMERFKFVK